MLEGLSLKLRPNIMGIILNNSIIMVVIEVVSEEEVEEETEEETEEALEEETEEETEEDLEEAQVEDNQMLIKVIIVATCINNSNNSLHNQLSHFGSKI